MANPKILEAKQVIIDEIANNVKESSSFIFLENTGLSGNEIRKADIIALISILK